MDTLELVGRQQELGLVAAALEDARGGRARSIALLGEPGIGKTATLQAAAGLARGFTVVRATGSPAEREYPYGGLLALMRPLRDDVAALPPTQRAALEAILAAEPGQAERFVVSAGALGVVAAAAEREPLLLIVDDVQWLDEPTRDVLAFVIRRLSADRVAVVVAARPGGLGALETAVDVVTDVLPLDDAAAAAVLTLSGGALDPVVREALLAAAHGNPLALLELPRRLTAGQLAGSEPLPPSLPAGELVSRAFAASAAALAEPTRIALTAAALVEERSLGELESALAGLGVTSRDLEPAEAEGLLVLAPGRVEFRHPLVRAAVLAASGDAMRRRVHRALAGALPPGERRALHLAEAAVGADPEAAAELVSAAADAPAVTAAALLTRAADLTVDDDARAGRLCAAAGQALAAGRVDQARSLADRALELQPLPEVRGAALVVLGRAARSTRTPADACRLLVAGAEALAPHDRASAVGALGEAFLAGLPAGDPAVTLPLAERFLSLADRGDPAERQFADVVEGIALVQSGRGADGATLLHSALDGEVTRSVVGVRPDELRVVAALWLQDFARAHDEASRALGEVKTSGLFGAIPRLSLFAGFALARLGRFDAAYAAVSEAAEMADELGQVVVWCDCANTLAGLEARLGLHDRCREHAERAIEVSTSLGLDWYAAHAAFQLALSELARGNATRVIEVLEGVHAANRERGVGDPGEYDLPDLVEAYLLDGRADLAAERLAELESLLERVPRQFEQALAMRCAALLAPDEEAAALFRCSVELHGAEMPFEVGRTHLLFGERLRRMGERRQARVELREALSVFESLDADWWAERCRRELAASGARLRKLDPVTRDELTPQELQVALQVAGGLSNREIAQTLFLSPKTVEFHLTRIYRKLGLHARAELIERFSGQVE